MMSSAKPYNDSSQEKPSILIVEDDEDLVRSFELAFSRDYAVSSTTDAVMATAAIRAHPPEVLILDLGIPGGGGMEILSRLSHLPGCSKTRTIVVTGQELTNVAKEASRLGAWRVFSKPMSIGVLRQTIEEAVESTLEHPRRKVLIVEDDLDFRKGVSLLMRAEGFEVISAQDGLSAVAMAQRSQPDAIILDMGLPGGDGSVVIERLRALGCCHSTPILVVSGLEKSEVLARCGSTVPDEVLSKPVENRILITKLRGALRAVPV